MTTVLLVLFVILAVFFFYERAHHRAALASLEGDFKLFRDWATRRLATKPIVQAVPDKPNPPSAA